jgi:hypothetical protein
MQTPHYSQHYINNLFKVSGLSPVETVRTPGELKNCIERAKKEAQNALQTINLTIQNRPHMLFAQKYLKQNPVFTQALRINLLSVHLPDITSEELSSLSELDIFCIHLEGIALEGIHISSHSHLALKDCTRLKVLKGNISGVFIENAPELTGISLPFAGDIYLRGTPKIEGMYAPRAINIFAFPAVNGLLVSLPKIKLLDIPAYTGTVDVSRMPQLELLNAENAARITGVPYYSSKPQIIRPYQRLPTNNNALLLTCVIAFLVIGGLSIAYGVGEANQCVVRKDVKHCFISGASMALALSSYVIAKFVWEKILVPAITGIELDSWHPIWRGRSAVRF